MCKHPPSFSHRLEFYDALCWFDLVPYFKYATCTIDGLWYHLTWRPCSGVTDLTWRSCSGVRMYSHFVRARLKRKVLHQVGSKILCLLIAASWFTMFVDCWWCPIWLYISEYSIFHAFYDLASSPAQKTVIYIYISTYRLGGPPCFLWLSRLSQSRFAGNELAGPYIRQQKKPGGPVLRARKGCRSSSNSIEPCYIYSVFCVFFAWSLRNNIYKSSTYIRG